LACLFLVCSVAQAGGPTVRTDADGDPLPEAALVRLGTVRWRCRASHLAFTPDAKTLITVENLRGSVVRCWDAETGRATACFRTSDSSSRWPHGFALAPDGKSLALNHQVACLLR
jgi:hypothetical protein